MNSKIIEIFQCLCCILCGQLYREATTINLCLHTFCKRCIYQAVQETKCCPQCKLDLGSSPEEHLKNDEKIQSIAQKIQLLQIGEGLLRLEADDVKQGAGTSKPPGTDNQLEDQEISGEKFHHKPVDAEKENTLDCTSSQESSAFPTNASAVKMPQVGCSVATTRAEIGRSMIEDNIKENKKKKRSKNRKPHQFTRGETSNTGEENRVIGPDDIHKEHAKNTVSSTTEKHVLEEKQRELSSFWFSLVPQGDKTELRLPSLDWPNIRGKGMITVTKIKKYIAQKLNMNDHTEVDVVCCGEKLNGDMTHKDIQLLWMSHLPSYGKKKKKWDLKEAMIELGYIRSEKPETSQEK
ncbi:E3 ubiquitin protein ligase DRIP1-like isoform X1 [Capsicum galapagoense]